MIPAGTNQSQDRTAFLAELEARRTGPWSMPRPLYTLASQDGFSQREVDRLTGELRAIAQTPLFRLRENLVRLVGRTPPRAPTTGEKSLSLDLPTGLEAAILRAYIERLEASVRFEVISADGGCCDSQWFRSYVVRSSAPGSAERWIVELPPGFSLTPLALFYFADAIRRAPHAGLFYGDCLDGSNPPIGYKPDFDPILAAQWNYLGGVRVSRPGGAVPLGAIHVPFPVEIGTLDVSVGRASPPRRSGETISAIIPTRDHPELLRRCVESLRKLDSAAIEIVIIDNGSRTPAGVRYLDELAGLAGVTVVRCDEPFNYSRLNNIGAFHAQGEILALVNDDVEFTEPDTLSRMAAYASKPQIGAVGPMLLYPDGRIQHAGQVIGFSGISYSQHVYEGAAPGDVALDPKIGCDRQISSVTGAVLAVEKAKYLEVGGLDESLAITCNDVDLCLKLRATGRQNVYAGTIRATHVCSQSRGTGLDPRHEVETGILASRWGADFLDPFYNPNLGLASEIGRPVPSRLRSPWLGSRPNLE